MLNEKLKDDEVENAPAMGDQLAAPGAMSHAEIVEKSKQFWQGPGCPGFEGTPPPAPRPSSTVYAQPASNLPAGPISVAELKSKADQHEHGGNNGLRPNTLPPPAF
jgi:hypothetical protein